ncbi:MAG TPA: beta-L-arabinofuranosidase domain-containing protein, partial [Sunxiuqinia sp.]|nr:beta-L-arabinofuranosidase domain-containing protein [Sunxiuqinia sp.]
MKASLILLLILGLLSVQSAQSQNKLYPNEFPLGDVQLLPSQFKTAEDLNIKNLLKYDTDRLLEPFLTAAGLPAKGKRYKNWSGLAGHVGGHYLSALSMNYAATGNTQCKERMDYMLSELKKCQDANGNGYVGGVPDSKAIWAQVKKGDFTLFHKAWVPWYNLHKTYAGLRDAWMYGKSELAKTMFLKLCDWGIDEISGLSYSQIQEMLNTEFGGMNEVYADAYEMTGDKKYLDAAKRFTHHMLFDSMAKKVDNLDNLHANTQIPKVIGFARVAQLSPA